MNKLVVVTGAAGFLGSHLALHHLEQGDQVIGVDNFCSSLGTFEDPSPHFRKLYTTKGFRFIDADISWDGMTSQLKAYLHGGCDLIYNFACPASPPRYQAIPVETMLTCVVGTKNMLELARRTGAVLVHASTSEVYGDPDCSPQSETYKGNVNSYGPRSCYDEGKRAAEALCFDYFRKYEVDARLVRIFNTYGPHMDPDDGRVVSNFICQALRGQKMTVYGGGTQSRSFCYVDDLIKGITALGSLSQNPGTPVNIGNPHEFTVMALATMVGQKVLGDRCLPWENCIDQKQALPVDDPLQRCPDITLAKELLGWSPQITLTDGLDRTINYFRGIVK